MPAAYFPIPPEQNVIRFYTGRAEQPIRTIIITAADAARAALDLPLLSALIEQYGRDIPLDALRPVVAIDTMIGRLFVELAPLLEDLIFRATSAGEQVFAQAQGIPPLESTNFRSQAAGAAREIVGNLVQGISQGWTDPLTLEHRPGALESIREIVAGGFEAGRTALDNARLVRDVIGLDDRRAAALERYALELEAKGVGEVQRLALIERERKKKLTSRARAISSTEGVRAASRAQDIIWEEGVREGQIDGVYEQEWVASPGACPRCRALAGARAPIGGEFPFPGGKGPPDPHTHCRCGRRLRRRGDKR